MGKIVGTCSLVRSSQIARLRFQPTDCSFHYSFRSGAAQREIEKTKRPGCDQRKTDLQIYLVGQFHIYISGMNFTIIC